MIPLPVIMVEFMAAFGLAMFLAYGLALVRLRRDAAGPPAADARPAPSTGRVVAGMVVGFLVASWAVATFVAKGFSF